MCILPLSNIPLTHYISCGKGWGDICCIKKDNSYILYRILMDVIACPCAFKVTRSHAFANRVLPNIIDLHVSISFHAVIFFSFLDTKRLIHTVDIRVLKNDRKRKVRLLNVALTREVLRRLCK